METCAVCKNEETELYENDVAVCIACSSERDAKSNAPDPIYTVHATLLPDLCSATKRAQIASTHFSAIADILTQLPQHDDTPRITNTARELAAARRQLLNAHNRLNDFLAGGIVPEDLK